jgi:hypothetical protein
VKFGSDVYADLVSEKNIVRSLKSNVEVVESNSPIKHAQEISSQLF